MLVFVLTATLPLNPLLICGAMVIYASGITLAAPIYGMESNVSTGTRGIAAGMSNALRYIIIASLVGIGSSAFDGSIKPVALLVGVSTTVVVLLAVLLKIKPIQLKSQMG